MENGACFVETRLLPLLLRAGLAKSFEEPSVSIAWLSRCRSVKTVRVLCDAKANPIAEFANNVKPILLLRYALISFALQTVLSKMINERRSSMPVIQELLDRKCSVNLGQPLEL